MKVTDQKKEAPLILIIDDDRFMRLQLRRAMEEAGYQVAEAANGEEGLAAYTRLHPDMVLLDAVMPVMDGFTSCKLMCSRSRGCKAECCDGVSASQSDRKLGATPPSAESLCNPTPILMITGLEDPESVDRAFEAGAIDYITKPIHWAVLRQRVRRLLEAYRAEKELRQQTQRVLLSEERLRLALDAARMSTWDWDIPNNKITYSPTTEANFGFSPSSFGSTYESFLASIHPRDRELVAQALSCALEQGTDYEIEYRIIWPDNSIHWIASKGQVYYDETDSPARMTGINMDITSSKHSEQQIRQQAALLDIATDAILVQNLENKILFWNKGAERLYGWKAEEAIGKNVNDFLYKEIPPELQKSQHILDETGSWQGELNQVAKSGKQIIVESRWTLVYDEQKQPKSILTVNTDITEKKQLEMQFLRAQRTESLGTLASGIAHELPPLTSDPFSLKRVLTELLNNACKYTPAKGKITVAVRSEDEKIQFSVTNSGIEIPASELPRIFDKFYRIPSNDPWKYGGTGLGLALVDKLVTYLGGSIQVQSRSTHTCFLVELPIIHDF